MKNVGIIGGSYILSCARSESITGVTTKKNEDRLHAPRPPAIADLSGSEWPHLAWEFIRDSVHPYWL